MTNRRPELLTIVILFVLGQLFVGEVFSLQVRPVMSPDSFGYLNHADEFPSLQEAAWGYTGYVVLIRLGVMLGSAAWVALLVNCVAVLFASSALLSLGRRFGGEVGGWVAVLIYLFHPLVAQWTRYVLTEPLFYAGTVITAWCLVEAIDHRGARWPPVWVAALLTASLRPNGILLIGSVVTVILITYSASRLRQILGTATVWLCVALAALTLPVLGSGGGGDHNAFGPRSWGGEVVWGVPDEAISMPEPASYDPSNHAYFRYAISHPLDITRLAATRVWWELKQVRPWYSRELNAFTAVSMAFMYSLALLGAWSCRRTSLNRVLFAVSAPTIALIGATWAIWEGRFGWWFLVLWTVWAGCGVQVALRRILTLTTGEPLLRGKCQPFRHRCRPRRKTNKLSDRQGYSLGTSPPGAIAAITQVSVSHFPKYL